MRSRHSAELLQTAHAAALQAGVTRLADITLLDRIGLPVWQAVRPASRALSVHQGKGWTARDAQIGALLEAVESHWGESFSAPIRRARWLDLPPEARPPRLGDVAANRDQPLEQHQPYEWVVAERLDERGLLFLPFDLVSLDFTRSSPSLFDRASNGVATGASRAEALIVSLHELIERDAMAEWQVADLAERMAYMLDPGSVGAPWFDHLRQAIAAAGAKLRCYAVPSLTGTPVFACEISDLGKMARPFRATVGHAAHPNRELALFKAVSEAIQSRAAFIAGARDDLYPWRYRERRDAIEVAYGLPLPPGAEAVDYTGLTNGPSTLSGLLEALARAGYPDAAAITLAEPDGLYVVRAFVCGLGSPTRCRSSGR